MNRQNFQDIIIIDVEFQELNRQNHINIRKLEEGCYSNQDELTELIENKGIRFIDSAFGLLSSLYNGMKRFDIY